MCISVIILSAAAAEGAPVVDDFDDDGTRDDGRVVRHNNKLYLPRARRLCELVWCLHCGRRVGPFVLFLSSLHKSSKEDNRKKATRMVASFRVAILQ